MNTILKTALAAAAVAFATQAAAQVTFYERADYEGQSFNTQKSISTFSNYGFNDLASSVVVQSSRWEACESANFKGKCVVLRPGNYPSLTAMGLNDRVSSVRVVSKDAQIAESRYAPTPVRSEVVFYETGGYGGRTFATKVEVGNLGNFGFNDRASSIVVSGNRWEACENAQFKGKCVVLRPGRYPSLASMGLNDRVTSVRQISWNTQVDSARYAPAPVAMYDNRRRNNERLYEANVTSVRAVVGPPEQRCWIEREQVQDKNASMNAAISAVLGYQVTGATAYQDVQKCATVPGTVKPDHWDVTYDFRGKAHRMQTTTPPGTTVTVNEKGEPRA
jgi:hypothetical protein